MLTLLGLARAAVALTRSGVLVPAITETLKVSGMIFGIVIAASILSLVFRGFGGDDMVAEVMHHVPGGAHGMLVVTMLVVFLLGFILEFVEIIFIVISDRRPGDPDGRYRPGLVRDPVRDEPADLVPHAALWLRAVLFQLGGAWTTSPPATSTVRSCPSS